VHALAEAGAGDVAVAARVEGNARVAAALAGQRGRAADRLEAEVPAADLIVNATPVGMGSPRVPFDVEPAWLRSGQVVVDLVYDPPVTPLLVLARERGAVAVNGLGMLIHQAAAAFRLWTGEDPPLEVMSAAAAGALAHRRDHSD
jgi:shikimate dehydrogenase